MGRWVKNRLEWFPAQRVPLIWDEDTKKNNFIAAIKSQNEMTKALDLNFPVMQCDYEEASYWSTSYSLLLIGERPICPFLGSHESPNDAIITIMVMKVISSETLWPINHQPLRCKRRCHKLELRTQQNLKTSNDWSLFRWAFVRLGKDTWHSAGDRRRLDWPEKLVMAWRRILQIIAYT